MNFITSHSNPCYCKAHPELEWYGSRGIQLHPPVKDSRSSTGKVYGYTQVLNRAGQVVVEGYHWDLDQRAIERKVWIHKRIWREDGSCGCAMCTGEL